MNDDREQCATFALDEIGWLDFECRSPIDIKAGTYRYAMEANAIICVYAIGDGPVTTVAVSTFDRGLAWSDMPDSFRQHYERVCRGEAVWAAWNAGFDKSIWNFSTDFPAMQAYDVIDVMAQAAASGLAGDLKTAALQSRSIAKDDAGADLIRLFCVPGAKATPQSHPDQWLKFQDYAAADIESMRSVFLGTRQLPLAEWREYWAMEAINERGVVVDLTMVEHAARLADQDKARSGAALLELTGGRVKSVDQVRELTRWLLDTLPPEGVEELVKLEEELDEDGETKNGTEYSLTRSRVERLIALMQTLPPTQLRETVLRVLQIRLYGGGKTPAKFQKIATQQVCGALYGQYVFNGAGQTGRASSKGVQIHNLARNVLPYEYDALAAIGRKCSYQELEHLGDDSPVARKLALLIRPTFVPRDDKVFVWSDWSNIEARVLPWLCDHLPGAVERLQIFRDVDADPSLPDLYTRTAAEIQQLPIEMVTPELRQAGKIAELALGFMGGVGALQKMAAGMGVHMDDDTAKTIVEAWRRANPWAAQFGNELWSAMELAREMPDIEISLGRLTVGFYDWYLGGSLLIKLPSGRLLTYRGLRKEMIDKLDRRGKVTGTEEAYTFARGHGRIKLWPGIFIENVTQATAADFLRGTLVRLNGSDLEVRLHTHDEILLETKHYMAEAAAADLRRVMQSGFYWSRGLPLMSEETVAYYYTKHKGSHGL